MDPIFQSLLLGGGGSGGSGGPAAPSPAGTDGSDGGKGGGAAAGGSAAAAVADRRPSSASSRRTGAGPRPSRYARLIPREAMRPAPSSGGGTEEEEEEEEREAGDVGGEGEEGESVRVYRRDGATGRVELLPEEEYDLVYFDDEDEEEGEEEGEDGEDEGGAAGGEDGEANGEGGGPTEEMDVEEGGEDEDGKDEGGDGETDGGGEGHQEGGGDEATEARSEGEAAMEVDDDGDDDSNSDDALDDDALYVVRGPPLDPRSSPRRFGGGSETTDASSLPPSSDSDDGGFFDGERDLAKSVPRRLDPRSTEASLAATTLARALVRRTTGFEGLRPGYGLWDEGEAEGGKGKKKKEKKKKDERKKKEEEENAGTTSAGSSSSPIEGTKEDGETDGGPKMPPSKEEEDDDDGGGGAADVLMKSSRELLASLPPGSRVSDGDAPATLLRLAALRRRQERLVEPEAQGLELDEWEDGIDWEGAAVDDDDDEEVKEEREKKKDPDDGRYEPRVPWGGRPKRVRRGDPMELLSEPLNPRLEALDFAAAVDWEGAPDPDDDSCDDSSDRRRIADDVPLILQSSVAGRSVAPLLAPVPAPRPPPFECHPSCRRRYAREASEAASSSEHPPPPPGRGGIGARQPGASEALERYKEARQRKREQMAKDKQSRVTEVMSALSLTGTGRRITSSLMGPGGAERTGRPSRHALGGSSVHDAEYVEQLELAYGHALVKPDLTLSEYRQFHRPRLPLAAVGPHCPWQFQARTATEGKRGARGGKARGGGAGAAGGAAGADGSTVVGSYHAMMSGGNKAQNKIRNEADLSPAAGDLVVLEYSEERLPLFMTKGTTCRIVNYYRGDRSRCPISAGGGDRPLRKRHGANATAEGASRGAPAGPSNRAERPPRLLGPNQYAMKSAADLVGIAAATKKKKGKEAAAAAAEARKAQERAAIDVLPEGVTEILHQKVHGPFIGEVEEGKTQTGLVSNCFAAPMFIHESEPTDFLMVMGQLQKGTTPGGLPSATGGGLGVVLRPLPANIFCVGQTEPRVKVFAPNTNDEKKFINAFVPYQVARNIERTEIKEGRGLTFDDIKDRLFVNTDIPHGQLRIRIKQVANFERANNGIWSLKAIGEDDFPGVEALGRRVSPEGVAAYESQCAAIRRLRDLGLGGLYSGGNQTANVASAMAYINGSVQAAMERRLRLKKVLELKRRQSSRKSSSQDQRLDYYEKAFEKLDSEYKEIKRRQEIAKFIYEELQLSPWNISGEFIDVHKRAVGGAMMKLTGIGDPSGVGEAYNFLREVDGRGSHKASAKGGSNDGALNAQIKKITGTQNDLRKLTMKQMASLLRSYGMKEKQIAVLKRWDRVHVIRDLSTKAASDGMGDEMERFARGEKLRLSDQRRNYKERIQEIWWRQVAALSAPAADAGADPAAKPEAEATAASGEASSDVAGNDAEKDKDDGSDGDGSGSSDEDDDFLAEMEMDMTNTGEANRLLREGDHNRGGAGGLGALDAQGMSRDARELAALQRQREEERAMILDHMGGGPAPLGGDKPKKKFKVVRRKITKTRPDGTQTVTFEFIVNRDKVEDIIEKKKQKEAEERKRLEKKKKKKYGNTDDSSRIIDPASACVGHATFEDEDNAKKPKRSVKLKITKETTVKRKGPGPRKHRIGGTSTASSTSSLKHSRAKAQEERKRKRLRQQEEAELYRNKVQGKGTSNRKERGSARNRMPHVILSDRLEGVRTAVEGRPKAGPFLKPVNRDFFPQYYEIILEPIDLQNIREKNRKYEYNTADKFVADFELMKLNAIKFNGRGSALANEAVEMWEFVKTTVEQNRMEFNRMEEAVRDMNNKKKKKGKSKKDTSSDAAPSSSKAVPMNTANVVLDGIETQVNLGANFSFGGLGGDSDSDDS